MRERMGRGKEGRREGGRAGGREAGAEREHRAGTGTRRPTRRTPWGQRRPAGGQSVCVCVKEGGGGGAFRWSKCLSAVRPNISRSLARSRALSVSIYLSINIYIYNLAILSSIHPSIHLYSYVRASVCMLSLLPPLPPSLSE
jgi:hypothetical protein